MAIHDAPLPKSCGFLLFRQAGCAEFLLMEHANRLDLPKGHVQPGESEMECAWRELEEETGLRPEQVQVDPTFRFELHYPVRSKRHGGNWVDKTLVVFLARLTDDAPICVSEHQGYQWVPWKPPQRIQRETVDPLLDAVARHWLAGQHWPAGQDWQAGQPRQAGQHAIGTSDPDGSRRHQGSFGDENLHEDG